MLRLPAETATPLFKSRQYNEALPAMLIGRENILPPSSGWTQNQKDGNRSGEESGWTKERKCHGGNVSYKGKYLSGFLKTWSFGGAYHLGKRRSKEDGR